LKVPLESDPTGMHPPFILKEAREPANGEANAETGAKPVKSPTPLGCPGSSHGLTMALGDPESNPGLTASQPEPRPHRRWVYVAAVTVASMLLHFSAFYVAESSFDLETWRIVAGSFLEDGDFYRAAYQAQRILERQYFVYPPLWGLTLYPFRWFVGSEFLFNFTVRILLMLFNLAVGFQLLRSFKSGLPVFTLWMLNPFVIGIAQAGNFDVIPAYLSLLSYRWLRLRRYDRSALSLGLGIAYKLYPAMLLPVFLMGVPSLKARARYVAAALTIPCISSLVYLAYSPFFLPSFIEGNAGRASALTTYIYAGLFAAALLYAWSRRMAVLESTLLILLPFYLITPAYNQYYIWMLPFLFAWLSGRRGRSISDLAATLLLLSALTLRRYMAYLTGKLPILQSYATILNAAAAALIYVPTALLLIHVIHRGRSGNKDPWENLL
jgi:hypothetical protein